MTFKVFNCLIGLSLIILAFTILTSASPHDIVMRDLEDLPPADPTGLACDKCIDHRANITFLYANGKCNTLDNGMKYYACGKPYRCGICMLFKGEQCMGDMIPIDTNTGTWVWGELKQAQSHYCISG